MKREIAPERLGLSDAAQIWIFFGLERSSQLRKMAASVIARYASQAAASGVKMGDLDLFPGIWVEPYTRLARRFKLFDYSAAMLRLRYKEIKPNRRYDTINAV